MKEHVFVIFGGTGDLTKRKLAPALAHLVSTKKIPPNSILIGIARGNYTDATYKELILAATKNETQRKEIEKLSIKFIRADTTHPQESAMLQRSLETYATSERKMVFYLATSFNLFSPVLNLLNTEKLRKNSIIIFEKPFGEDLASAKKLEEDISSVFPEENVFRIDHYLAKETVRNIRTLKFHNMIFEGLLNNRFVDSIDMVVHEDLGVGERLGYYNAAGAVKDMIQNHMLQVLALLLMDHPAGKLDVLKDLHWNPKAQNLLGQYHSYKSESEKVNIPHEKIETFARLHFLSTSPRLKGVDIRLQTGKRLPVKASRITINFKNQPDVQQNKIVIDIYPKQDIRIHFNTRNPHSGDVQEAFFDFCHECLFGPNSVNEYAFLLEEALKGNREFFPSREEVLESWRIVEEIDRKNITFKIYEDGSLPK